jgi:heme-degrading monooxygenase HmoA
LPLDDKEGEVVVYSVWESIFPADAAGQGRTVTEAIWQDMLDFDGYLDHGLLVDADDPGHLLVVSRWASREDADSALESYRDHPNAQAANRLVSEPRRRTLATPEPKPTAMRQT